MIWNQYLSASYTSGDVENFGQSRNLKWINVFNSQQKFTFVLFVELVINCFSLLTLWTFINFYISTFFLVLYHVFHYKDMYLFKFGFLHNLKFLYFRSRRLRSWNRKLNLQIQLTGRSSYGTIMSSNRRIWLEVWAKGSVFASKLIITMPWASKMTPPGRTTFQTTTLTSLFPLVVRVRGGFLFLFFFSFFQPASSAYLNLPLYKSFCSVEAFPFQITILYGERARIWK